MLEYHLEQEWCLWCHCKITIVIMPFVSRVKAYCVFPETVLYGLCPLHLGQKSSTKKQQSCALMLQTLIAFQDIMVLE